LTLTGIILNALMQGYVCSISIHVYLIENIEQQLPKHKQTLTAARDEESG